MSVVFMHFGSFNWAAAATNSNNKNLIMLGNSDLGAEYEAQFQQIYSTAT